MAEEFDAYRNEELIFLSTHPDFAQPKSRKTLDDIQKLRDKAVDRHIEKAVGRTNLLDRWRNLTSKIP